MVFFNTDKKIKIQVFTTRLDTIYGVSFLVLAPENKLVKSITTKECTKKIKQYQTRTL